MHDLAVRRIHQNSITQVLEMKGYMNPFNIRTQIRLYAIMIFALFIVTSCDNMDPDDDQMSNRPFEIAEILGCSSVSALEFNEAVNSQLANGDCNLQTLEFQGQRLGNGTLIEYWGFRIESPGLVTITVNSTAFDPVLFLLSQPKIPITQLCYS